MCVDLIHCVVITVTCCNVWRTLSWLDLHVAIRLAGSLWIQLHDARSFVIGPRVISNRYTSASSSSEIPTAHDHVLYKTPSSCRSSTTKRLGKSYRQEGDRSEIPRHTALLSVGYFWHLWRFLGGQRHISYWAPTIRVAFKACQSWSSLTQRQLKKFMNFSKCQKRRGLVLREWRS